MTSVTDNEETKEEPMGLEVLSRPAEEFENDGCYSSEIHLMETHCNPQVEVIWAMKAYEHAEIYFNILCSVDPKSLRLTPRDDKIYSIFRQEFPDLDVRLLIEDELKSVEGKKKWREFCEKFKEEIEDYSFGTLIRADVSEDYSEKNSILVTRIQFFAIEIARNREGYNDDIRMKFKPSRTKK